MLGKKEVVKEVAKEEAKTQARDSISSRADTVSPPLEGEGGQVQEFYPLGAGSEVVPPTEEEVTAAVEGEAGK
jgi:hypothetical protein